MTGEWRSELGSQLLLRAVGSEVRGVYRTAVESARGAAGQNNEAKVVGVISDNPQPTVAFSVLWAKGNRVESPDPNDKLMNRTELKCQTLSCAAQKVLQAQEAVSVRESM